MRTYKKAVIPSASRREVAIRYGCHPGGQIEAKCNYCENFGVITWAKTKKGNPSGWIHFSKLELDHIIAERVGGSSKSDNLQILCRSCNRKKGIR